ncbi:MAG: MBL fold metallo-hydrolase [Flavisolibacter sp.]|nr:MBL fold metallo-hydrolase [Flavisolibacter sp.]
MKIIFHGGARTVTGSKHILELNDGRKILLDCGMFQGLGSDTDDLNENFGFDPSSISCLILSHAHIDHSGLIPRLVKLGFNGKIFCREATKELTEILLYDSAEIQNYETSYINKRREKNNLPPYQPLYTSDDVADALGLFEIRDVDHPFEPIEGVSVVFTNAGHLIGSASIHITVKEEGNETTVFFSGDVGRYRSVLLQPPQPFQQADYIILESTYGNKHHDISFSTIKELRKIIEETCIQNEGQLIIPAFSVGRTQEILYALNQLSLEKRLPETFYFVDSPLSLKATTVIKKFKEQFSDRLQQVLEVDDDPFDFPGLKYIENVEDSKKLTDATQPCVIISASGTADAGRVRHHINSCISKSNCTILMVGYCGSGSLGGQLLSGKRQVEIFNEPLKVKARIGQLPGMSAHADADDLLRFLGCQDPEKTKKVFLVHGEYDVQQAFIARPNLRGFEDVEIPGLHQQFDLTSSGLSQKIA